MQCGESRFLGKVVEERERRVRGEIKGAACWQYATKFIRTKIRN